MDQDKDTCGPLFWLLCCWVIVKSLDLTINAATFYSTCNTIITNITYVSFEDDTLLAAISEYKYNPIDRGPKSAGRNKTHGTKTK